MLKPSAHNAYSSSSRTKLSQARIELQAIFQRLLPYVDHGIIETFRSDERQLQLYNDGLSYISKGGKHNTDPSEAVDFYIYYPHFKTYLTLDQSVIDKVCNYTDCTPEEAREWIRGQYYICYALLSLFARDEGITIRWGGKWNRHGIIDQEFDDFFHIELVE